MTEKKTPTPAAAEPDPPSPPPPASPVSDPPNLEHGPGILDDGDDFLGEDKPLVDG